MDFMTLFGLIIGVGLTILGILAGGAMKDFYDVGSIQITMGGTVAALMINFPLNTLISSPKYIKKALIPDKFEPKKYVLMLVDLAQEARKNGLLSLERRIDEFKDPFLRYGILLVVDAIEPERIRSMMEMDLNCLEERHTRARQFFEKAAAYAPGFGMLGTLIGLVNMLKKLDDPDLLGPNMAIALITTFYGAILSNLVFLPIAGKLKIRHDEEMLCKQMIIDGVLAIQAGESYRHIQDKLLAYLPPKQRIMEDTTSKDKVA